MKPFKILSIDGGGLRGIIPVMLLEYIEQKTGKRITDCFDLIAGTSTGGLIACGLTITDDHKTPKYSLGDIADIYLKKGNTIFPVRQGIGKLWNDLTSLWSPEFSDSGIDSVLQNFVGEARLSDCLLPLFISSYDIRNNQCIFFKTRHAHHNPSENARLYDICRATSAAPTYLPAYSFNFNNQDITCIDGGVYINNPAVGATVEVHKYAGSKTYNRNNDISWEDIHVLSLGTGHYSGVITEKPNVKWGDLQWITRISDIMMYGVNQTTDYEEAELLKRGNYCRIGIEIKDKEFSDMSDARPKTMGYLKQSVHDQFLNNEKAKHQLNEFIKKAEI